MDRISRNKYQLPMLVALAKKEKKIKMLVVYRINIIFIVRNVPKVVLEGVRRLQHVRKGKHFSFGRVKYLEMSKLKLNNANQS